MKLKTLVVAAGAAAVGYVLGTKAGLAQFEQLKAKADELAHDPRVRSGVSSIAGEVKNHADKLPDPVWVARTVRVALANPVPLARYVVGADAAGGILSETLLPTVLTDVVKAAAVGLRSSPIRIPFLP